MSASSKRKGRGRPNDSPDVKLSKSLSYILRHGAEKEKITITSDGFVSVTELLKNSRFDSYSFEDIQRVVDNNEKKRFVLENKGEENNDWYIRASQGHSLKNVELQFQELKDLEGFPDKVIHGTYTEPWKVIKTKGLSTMNRTHIHMASGKFGEEGVISGMRKSAEVFIYIDVSKALSQGIKFYVSDNGVILSAGNENGIIPPELFLKVEDKQEKRLESIWIQIARNS